MNAKKQSGVELARQRDLAGHERVIENARQGFIDWGRSLGKIRLEKLYEVDGYADFDEYVSERWEMRPQHAYRLISAARVALILSPMGYKINNERAARELAPVADDPEMLKAVYEEAERRAGGGRVTAALIAASREALAPQVIDGDWSDDDEADLSGVVTAMRGAIEEVEHRQASAGVALDSNESADDESKQVKDHTDEEPDPVVPVDAPPAQPEGSGAASGSAPAEQEEPPVDSPPAEPERAGAGVSLPAPDPDLDDDEQRMRDWRRGVSRDLMQALVDVHMRLQPSPAAWLEKVYLHGSYPDRDMPRVRECFSPDSIRTSAQYLFEVAEWLEMNGVEL